MNKSTLQAKVQRARMDDGLLPVLPSMLLDRRAGNRNIEQL